MEFAGEKANEIAFSLLKTVWFLVICHISFSPLDFNLFHLSEISRILNYSSARWLLLESFLPNTKQATPVSAAGLRSRSFGEAPFLISD